MSAALDDREEIPSMFVSSPSYDDMGAILDRLDLEYEDLDGVDLERRDDGIVMLNCSFSWDEEVDLSALDAFVRDGGALLASDLTYPAIEHITGANFVHHDWGNEVDVEVVDPELAELLGQGRLSLDFDTALKRVESLPHGAEPLLRTVEGGHVIAYQSSVDRGTVLYTSFHNHSQSSDVEDALLQVLLMVPIAASTGTSVRQAYTTVVYGDSSASAPETDDGSAGSTSANDAVPSDSTDTVIKDVRSADDDTGTVMFSGDESTTVTLAVIDGGTGAITRTLPSGGSARIGRDDFAGLVDESRRQYVSGTHLELHNDAASGHPTLRVRDADSTNGTSINGDDVSDGEFHDLQPDDAISLAGEVRVEVRLD